MKDFLSAIILALVLGLILWAALDMMAVPDLMNHLHERELP